ncbi:hypothetical protein MPG53_02365 [Helicobacter pylori]|uniref:hypothetical protein n=2 Tax=Helicobacter pylori TaxID=210 RepID=UPI001FD484E6|nr:hypothetical protein [Helicobacter pylori]UOS30387.1 hypothetical protein MPG53_02365 [Helicobacter pylori]
MLSDSKNIFIGANNSKRTKSNLIDNEKDPINSHSVGYDDLTMAQKMNTTALFVWADYTSEC